MRIPFVSTALLAAAVCIPLTFISGCTYLGESKPYKETRRFYYTHVNTPAKLDLSKPDTLGDADSRLVTRLMEIDAQLTALERALASTGSEIDQRTAEYMARRFPWLSSMLVVDGYGTVLTSAPPVLMKNLNFQPLLETPPSGNLRDIRAHVQDTDLGPEVMMARPFFNGQELEAMLVVTFDFRSLMSYIRDDGYLLVRTPETLLWAGDNAYGQGALSGVDWNTELRSRSYGTIGQDGMQTAWLVRYLGYVPLIFASPAS